MAKDKYPTKLIELILKEEITFTRRVIKTGHSMAITIPAECVKLWKVLKGREVRKVKITVKKDGSLIVTPL